jgi:uncharacterized membrane protein YgdD (TMEM256/DUF423 family)
MPREEGNMARGFLVTGSLFGLTGVAAGAFGAHALRGVLEPRMLEVFQVAVRYQMLHALALLAAAWVAQRAPGAWAVRAGTCLAAGIALFSGSLYVVTLGGPTWAGAVTPLGGITLMAGWACLALAGGRLDL